MTNKAEIEALRTFLHLPADDWQPHDWDSFEAARERAERLVGSWDRKKARDNEAKAQRAARSQPKVRKPLAAQSKKRKAEAPVRAEVRDRTIVRAGGRCEGPERGLPGQCYSPHPDRPRLEVHETTARGTHPGSHLNEDVTVALCQHHHDMCTSPKGVMRERVEALGLLVRAGALAPVVDTKGRGQ